MTRTQRYLAHSGLLVGLATSLSANATQDELWGDGFDGFPSNVCDTGLAANSAAAYDYAKAIGLCAATTVASHDWGVIAASFTKADGTPLTPGQAVAIRPSFGTNNPALSGSALAVLSTGHAATPANPGYVDFQAGADNGVSSALPADWLAANGNTVPTAPGCPPIDATTAHDPVMLTLDIRVPNNARSFNFALNYFGADYPEYVCSNFNDVFVALLDSTSGSGLNPADKNLAGIPYPVGVNFAKDVPQFFTQCVNGTLACNSGGSTFTTIQCQTTAGLVGTGMDTPDYGCGDNNSLLGGATGWLQVQGNVVPGETIHLRLGIWDSGDYTYDSLVLLDDFRWSSQTVPPGIVTRVP